MDISNKCWGHHCEDYKDALMLWDKIKDIADGYNQQRIVLTFKHLLFKLDLDETTANHWATCKPNNLKVLAKARILCDETIYHAISKDPKLLFEYWKLTRQGSEAVANKDQKLDVSAFIEEEGKEEKD